MSTATLGDVFDIDLDIAKAANIFAYYVGALFFLAYFLSLFVSSLHVRQDSVVYPLTRPELGQDFVEYIIVAKTSLLCGSAFDTRGRIMMTLKGSFDESPPLYLKKGKGIECFLQRGSVNIFVYHSPTNLGDIEGIDVKLINDAPYEIPYVQWRPSFITIMNPLTREEWGTAGVGRMVCPGVLIETMQCCKGKRENHGIFKSLCLFHPVASLFNCPVRIGLYNNMVNAIFIFFLFSLLMTSVLIAELALNLNKVENLTYEVLYTDATVRALACAGLTWTCEVFLETLVRNTVPRVSAVRYALFRGLMEPIQSHHALRDFSINLDWDTVRPLILNKYVTMVSGVVHLSPLSVFARAHSFSIANLWGYFTPNEARETAVFVRKMNECALPLPATLRWISKEANSLKEEILFNQFDNNFKLPMCFFCCWLRDWPVNMKEEQWQNGLVLSHIISRDILSLMKMKSRESQARKAQICMHQWYGMICCLFLQVLKQNIYIRSDSIALIKAFFQRTVAQFGRRSAREIQATWRARLHKLNANPKKKLAYDFFLSGQSSNANVNFAMNPVMPWMSPFYRRCETIRGFDLDNPDYLEDDLRFDEDFSFLVEQEERERRAICQRIEAGGEGTMPLATQPLIKYSVIHEGQTSFDFPSASKKPISTSPSTLRSRRNSLKNRQPTRTREENIWKEKDVTDDINSAGMCSIKSPFSSVSSLNENSNALEKTNEEKAKEKTEKDKQIKMLLQQKKAKKKDYSSITVNDRHACPISGFEKFSLGVSGHANLKPEPTPQKDIYLRHKDEIAGYNCGSKQCLAFVDIHKMVGNSCMEILKRLLQDLLFFALDSPTITKGAKMWQRKRMVLKLFEEMDKKSAFYEDSMFTDDGLADRENYACNQSLTTNLTMLEVLLGVAVHIHNTCAEADAERRKELYMIPRNPQQRCLYCARKIEKKISDPGDGCSDFEKLVKFFTRETIHVAELEVNAEMSHKITLQRFCAGIMNMAEREMLMELEDPPMVLSTKITRALLYKMLELKSPKASTDFREMSADELRRVGTRRERIQARHDASIGRIKKDSAKQKKEKAINSHLVETFSSKWRVTAKENEVHYCAHLLAQCLVQEKILGFSIYSGFISKEHEILLEGSKAHLIEVEKKATKAVLKIGNVLLEKRLDAALRERDAIDVVFSKTSVEAGFTVEAVSVMQVLIEPTFLKTCCFYINDIVERKIAEFIEFFVYMTSLDPLKSFVNVKKVMREPRVKYKMDKPIEEQSVADHNSISTPVLRWGVEGIKGVEPLPQRLKESLTYEDPESLLAKVLDFGMRFKDVEPLATLMLKTRRKAKKALESRETEELKKLQLHLARVQARLTEQVALASQNASDSAAVETDFQREYHRDELFNVELYATRDLQRWFGTALGFIILPWMVLMTMFLMLFTTFRTSNMELEAAKEWFIACGKAGVMYVMALQPVKCFLYSLFRVYRI